MGDGAGVFAPEGSRTGRLARTASEHIAVLLGLGPIARRAVFTLHTFACQSVFIGLTPAAKPETVKSIVHFGALTP
jgi:hypothetical protein